VAASQPASRLEKGLSRSGKLDRASHPIGARGRGDTGESVQDEGCCLFIFGLSLIVLAGFLLHVGWNLVG
jgi:hypothetical protein